MTTPGGWGRRLAKLEVGLPTPPPGSPYHAALLAQLGHLLGLARREPDFAAALAAYRALTPPYGDEAGRLHDHLCALAARADAGVPPCSAAEFAGLAAWLAEHGEALPATGWKKEIAVGDGTTATLYDLKWRAAQGATGRGSGGVAEAIRKLRAAYGEVPKAGGPGTGPAGGRRAPATAEWTPSVERDDGQGES